jgi:hypothetical protein
LHRVTLGPQPSGVLFALLPDGTEGIRTPTLLIASQTLSQIELRPRKKVFMEWRRQGFGKSTHAVSPVFTTVPRNRRDSHPQCLCGGVFSNVIPQAFFASNCPKFVFVTPRQGSVSVFDLPRGGTTDTTDDPNRGIEPIRRSTSELQAGLPPVPESNREPPDSFKIPLPSFRQRDEERFFHPSSFIPHPSKERGDKWVRKRNYLALYQTEPRRDFVVAPPGFEPGTSRPLCSSLWHSPRLSCARQGKIGRAKNVLRGCDKNCRKVYALYR